MRGVGGEIEAGHRSAPARAARPLLCFNTGSKPSRGTARPDKRAGAAYSSRATSPCSLLLLFDTSADVDDEVHHQKVGRLPKAQDEGCGSNQGPM